MAWSHGMRACPWMIWGHLFVMPTFARILIHVFWFYSDFTLISSTENVCRWICLHLIDLQVYAGEYEHVWTIDDDYFHITRKFSCRSCNHTISKNTNPKLVAREWPNFSSGMFQAELKTNWGVSIAYSILSNVAERFTSFYQYLICSISPNKRTRLNKRAASFLTLIGCNSGLGTQALLHWNCIEIGFEGSLCASASSVFIGRYCHKTDTIAFSAQSGILSLVPVYQHQIPKLSLLFFSKLFILELPCIAHKVGHLKI